MWKVYKIINLITNKIYVGVTKRCLNIRLIEHLSRLKRGVHPSNEMKIDYEKYGKKSFLIELVKEGEFEDVCKIEKDLTKKTVIDGYNTIVGGFDAEERGNAGRIFHKKLRNNPEMMRKWSEDLSLWNKGKVMSEDARKKMSIAGKGRKWKPEYKVNRSLQYSGSGNPNAGKFSTYLNTQTGIFYETPDLLNLLGISKSCLVKYNRDRNNKVNNFIKV